MDSVVYKGREVSAMDGANQPVVIDNGSGMIKAGFAGKDKVCFTT
jgi:hypothetical protein